MPYRVSGNRVLHLKGGKWKVKQVCSSHANALKAVRLLRGVEHGMTPRKQKKKNVRHEALKREMYKRG